MRKTMESHSADISNKVLAKLKTIVHDSNELTLIEDLLSLEKRYAYSNPQPQRVKKEFQLLLDQHFPLPRDDNE